VLRARSPCGGGDSVVWVLPRAAMRNATGLCDCFFGFSFPSFRLFLFFELLGVASEG